MAYVIDDTCVACGTCASVCPTGAIKKRNSRAPTHGSTTNFFHTQIFHPK